MEFFLFYHENVCCVYSLKLPHQVHSAFNIPLFYRLKTSLNYLHLPPDLVLLLTLSGSNYRNIRKYWDRKK